MSEAKWTPEPWGCVGTETATHQIVSRTLDPESDPVVLMEITDYDRSVACVNALVGIADPEAFVKRAKAIEEAAKAVILSSRGVDHDFHSAGRKQYEIDLDALKTEVAKHNVQPHS